MDWLPWLLVLGAIWGSSFLFIKVAVTELDPLWVAAGRLIFGGAVLGVIMVVRRLRLPSDPRAWLHGAVLGIVNCAIPFALFAFAGERIPSLLSGLWNSAMPLVVLPLAVFVFRTEEFTVRRLLGVLIGLAGAAVLLGVWDLSGDGYDLAGQLMCLAAISCYGIGTVWSRRFLSPRPEPPIVGAGMQMICGTVAIVPVALLAAGPPGRAAVTDVWVVASVMALGALGTGIAFAINLRNIGRLGAVRAAAVTYLVPVFATIVGVAALGERLAWHHVLGGLVILAGVAVAQNVRVQRASRAQRRTRSNQEVS